MDHHALRELLECLEREQACYAALLDLARRQHALIVDESVDDLLRVLGHKQRLLATVGRLEERLAPFKQNWQQLKESLAEEDRAVVREALAAVEELLGELIQVERDSERALSERRNAAKHAFDEAKRGMSIHNAYAHKKPTPDPHGPSGTLLDSSR